MQKFVLAEITTKDNLVHQGIFFSPSTPTKKAILWVHGLTSRFYGDVGVMNLFAQACEEEGWGFASFNNRGHDIVTSIRKVDKRKKTGYARTTGGAGYEIFSQSIHDIGAAISFLASKGFSQIYVAGHSTGANKACYYAATKRDPKVAGIVLAGPMSDRSEYTRKKSTYTKLKEQMEEKIKNGEEQELLTRKDFFALTPNRWMSLYVPGSHEDVFNYMDKNNSLILFSQIRKPLLVVFSELDEHADRPMKKIKEVFDARAKSKIYKSIILPGATHSYAGKEKEFVSAVTSWIKTL